eukprot:CAMPEP_0168608328 /NCGR_PEP_ID=MMETSP0449_2-20121227/564_1 /TAXON_ID=1082188 /ORGANISM="Strombidium rassoulzadegani, Strain ras09" /LENGTH=32 /DNA_ID= /DNA_START= /DNA_END= /DNA_ORIENTATION=
MGAEEGLQVDTALDALLQLLPLCAVVKVALLD